MITLDAINEALDRMAWIVDRYGVVYLPIYERLERERADYVEREASLSRVRQRLQSARDRKQGRSSPARPGDTT